MGLGRGDVSGPHLSQGGPCPRRLEERRAHLAFPGRSVQRTGSDVNATTKTRPASAKATAVRRSLRRRRKTRRRHEEDSIKRCFATIQKPSYLVERNPRSVLRFLSSSGST